ncbi:MAG: M48 family metallopeptidase [Acidobacteria bacterium]|nr:M48 family metallopeptidase [Acidobacteriota bacterium]
MNQDKSARYHQLKRRAAVLSVGWTAFLLVFVLLSGLHLQLRDLSVRAAGYFPGASWWLELAAAIIVFVAVLGALDQIAALPLAFYSGFVLEHRYGLSTQPAARWGIDYLKSGALGFGLGAAGVTLLYVTIRNWPDWWWMIGAAGLSVVLIVLVNLGPILILPLFFEFKPLARQELQDRLVALAERAGARVMGVFEWKLGDRTKKANAALTGVAQTRRILLSDTLLAEYSDDEIEVVLAHELAHHVHHDLWKGIALEAAVAFGAFYVADRLLRWAGPLLDIRSLSDIAGLPLVLIAAAALSIVVLPAVNAVSRANERAADRFALDVTRKPEAFVSAMRRLGAQHLAEENPSRLVQWIFYSHPPVKQRIAAAMRHGPG